MEYMSFTSIVDDSGAAIFWIRNPYENGHYLFGIKRPRKSTDKINRAFKK